MWQEIAKFGKKLVDRGLVESHFGNLSIRKGSKMLITKSGSTLDEITETSVVELDIDRPSSFDSTASSETIVHRMIYNDTEANAIIHSHSPFAVIESLLVNEDRIFPMDIEGQYYLQEIIIVKGDPGTPELANNAAEALKKHQSVVIFRHGTFAIGKNLEEAYSVSAQIEHSCKLKYYFDLARK